MERAKAQGSQMSFRIRLNGRQEACIKIIEGWRGEACILKGVERHTSGSIRQ
jgi:hypothetical protein